MQDSLPLARGGGLELHGCLVMGILNATPDSFSDGGELAEPDALARRIRSMLDAGADILDVGGESTRPGHTTVPVDVEKARVLPVIATIRAMAPDAPVSIDTRKALVAEAALRAGADLINDVSGLQDPDMPGVVKRYGCAVVAMRHDDCHADIVTACRDQLAAIHDRALASGIAADAIVLDPGLGFGERPGPDVEDNLALIDNIPVYAAGRPVLIGASRKRFTATLAGLTGHGDRIRSSVEMAVRAAEAGAAIVRVHDVEATVAALSDRGLRLGQQPGDEPRRTAPPTARR